MKKIVIISSVVFGLTLASCQKEVIIPKHDSVLHNDTGSSENVKKGGAANSGKTSSSSTTTFQGGSPDVSITDPNNDPDINRKKK